MSGADDLSALVDARIAAALAARSGWQIMTVDSVQADGTVNLVWGDQILPGIACAQSYTGRRAGDTVLVLRHAGGWRVTDKAGAEVPSTVTDWASLTGTPTVPDVTWGTGPPAGSGWQQAQTMWVKGDGVYAQLGSTPTVPAPVKRPAPSPPPVTVPVQYTAGYRSGKRDGTHNNAPIQSVYGYSAFGPWTGGWFYGDAIRAACAGKTVATMTMYLRRSGVRHGDWGPTTTHLWLHDFGSRPATTPALHDAWNPTRLGLGASDTVTLPGWMVNALAAGGHGIGCAGGGYLIYTNTCGDLRITFV